MGISVLAEAQKEMCARWRKGVRTVQTKKDRRKSKSATRHIGGYQREQVNRTDQPRVQGRKALTSHGIREKGHFAGLKGTEHIKPGEAIKAVVVGVGWRARRQKPSAQEGGTCTY